MIEYPDPPVAGTPYTMNAQALALDNGGASARTWLFWAQNDNPSWLTLSGDLYGGFTTATGTPPAAGPFTVVVDYMLDREPITVTLEALGAEPITAPAPVFDDERSVVLIPEDDRFTFYVDGREVWAGAVIGSPAGSTVTVTVTAPAGYVLEGPDTWTHTYAAGGGGESPEFTEWLEATTGRVGRLIGGAQRPGRAEAIGDGVDIIAQYVRAYVRALDGSAGRGFSAAGVPVPALSAVIVTAAIRLAANPRQVSYYQSGDYSERPAVMAGWTAAELATLRRYRRVTA